MPSSTHVDSNEKHQEDAQPRQSKGFFSRSTKSETVTVESEKSETSAVDIKAAAEPGISPVDFSTLFRFSTKFELAINLIGLICAAAAGAATPLMSLLFSNLTQQFVNFGAITTRADAGDTEAATQIPAAADAFRKAAASNASYLVYIGVGMLVCTFAYMYIWVYTGEINTKRIRERYLRAILRQDVAFFDNVGAGEVATRIETDTHLVQAGISEKVALTANFMSSFLTGFILAYVRSWRLALATSALLPCMAITGTLMAKYVSAYEQLSLSHVAEGGNMAEQVISTVRTTHAFGTQAILGQQYNVHIAKARMVDLKATVWHGGGVAVFFFFTYSTYALAFSFGTTLINKGQADAGAVVNVFTAILVGSMSLAMIAPQMEAITHACAAAAKLFQTIDRVPTIDSADPGGKTLATLRGEIELEHVDFSYPSRPGVTVVKDLSLRIPAGKTTALVGASGSGKSTIVSLVERFYDPLSGIVKLDGVDVKELNVTWLRSQIGLVSQEPTLFATTIKGNVAHGLINTIHEHASEEEKFALIKEACIRANADSFIMKLPLGYDTMVGERGFLLSGGQKQRVAIARAIVSDPKVLLLDEATSALDTQSEGIVQDALDKAAAGRTTVTIAHRLSTIKDAFNIVVMGDGVILQQGTHSQLLEDTEGAYHRLVSTQQLREARGDEPTEDNHSDISASGEDADQTIPEKVSLEHGHLLAREVIEPKRQSPTPGQADHSFAYVFKRLVLLNRDGWMLYRIGSIFAIFTGMVYPAFGLIYAKGIVGFSKTDNRERRFEGDRNALWFFVIAVGACVCVGVQNYMFARAAAKLTSKLRSLTFKAILRQDVEFFDKDTNSTGSLVSTLADNPQKVNGLAGITLGVIVQSLSTLVAGSVLGLAISWKLSIVGVACVPFLVSTGYIRLRVVDLKDQLNKRLHEGSAHMACEASGAIRTVASLTREEDCSNLYSASLEGSLKQSNKSALWSNLLFATSQASVFFVISLVFWWGSRLVASREYGTFQFFVGLMSTTFSAIQVGSVFSFIPDISSAKGAGSDIFKLLDSTPEIDAESSEGKTLDASKIQGHIRLENVHFRYPTRPDIRVLSGISLEVTPGTYVALVGASGSGKSTVIQLIERFYNPLAGHIYFDNESIAKLNVQEYRKHISLVSQEPTLYSGTVRYNILLGAVKPHEEVTQAEIDTACRGANILEFITSLPEGFDTEVGGKGNQLSGGQKQRIAIARALLRNPKVLLLDEATSALDSNSEKVVQEALDKATKGRATIAVAHRLSTIQNADKIYFIKEGAVSESGTHDQLLKKKGDYYQYVQLQKLSNAA